MRELLCTIHIGRFDSIIAEYDTSTSDLIVITSCSEVTTTGDLESAITSELTLDVEFNLSGPS